LKGKVIMIGLAILAFVVAVGYMSGRQPDRDAVVAARKELGTAFREAFVDANGVRLHVVIAGPDDGKPILLLHGYPEFWYAWRGVMANLARKGYRVIALDQRGYNRSAKPGSASSYRLDILAKDVVDVAAALGHERFVVVGHDFGGQVTWWTALLHPRKVVGALVVNKPHPYAIRDVRPEGEAISWYRTFLRVPWLPGHVARYGNWGLLEKNLQDTSEPGTFSKQVMDQYKAAWDHDGAIHSMGAWYQANAKFDADVGAGLVAVPARLLLAKNDAFSPPELAFASEQYFEKGDVRELGIGTHWVIQEHPRLIAEEIDKFVDDLEWASNP
jgi:pimeloyl-ACP methyl ester carboxylesterase